MNIVLVEPEIPMNTGNIARSCAATGAILHLVGPLGFDVSAAAVKRAGLDYWHLVEVHEYPSIGEFWRHNETVLRGALCVYLTSKATMSYTDVSYSPNAWIFFGRETRGLPEPLLAANRERCLRIPIRPQARSLNLANAVAVVLFEAMRQNEFYGLTAQSPEAGRLL